jgi:hypothetical protein
MGEQGWKITSSSVVSSDGQACVSLHLNRRTLVANGGRRSEQTPHKKRLPAALRVAIRKA